MNDREEDLMTEEEQLKYLKSTGLFDGSSNLYYPARMIHDKNAYVSVSDLVERFIEMDSAYKADGSYSTWNIRQILANIYIIVPKIIEE